MNIKEYKNIRIEFDKINDNLYSIYKKINNEFVSFPFMCMSSYEQKIVLVMINQYKAEQFAILLKENEKIPF